MKLQIEMILLIIGTVLGFVLGTAVIFLLQKNKFDDLHSAQITLTESNRFLSQDLSEKKSIIQNLDSAIKELRNYQGRFEQAEVFIAETKLQNQHYQREIDLLNSKIAQLNRTNDLTKQERDNLVQEKQDWHKEKEAILYQLSEELIRKNNEEQSKFGSQQQETIKKITESLLKNFEEVLNKVSNLNLDVERSKKDIFETKNALLNPGGAGRTSEITLENILKSSGLKEKLTIKDSGDFILQSHFYGNSPEASLADEKSGKRPDAILFLPNNRLWIIDSKSSSHFIELERAKQNQQEQLVKEISIKIKESMKKHLEDLKKKDYANSKLEELNLQNLLTPEAQPQIATIMFLQTERMLEIVRNLDENIFQRALEANIWLVGPIGLVNLLNQAKVMVSYAKQEQNIEQLRIEIKKLIDSVVMMSQKSKEMGKSIYRAMRYYDEFAGSFNSRFLSRINNLNRLGIESNKKSSIDKLERYHITIASNIIEGSVIEESEISENE